MLKIISLFIALCLVACTAGQDSANVLEETCTPVPGLFIANRTREIECCEVVITELYRLWASQQVYLTKSLATLESWNCPQLDEVCSNRFLDFTEYTALVYDRFCNQSRLLQQCEAIVSNAIQASGFSSDQQDGNWTDLASQLDPLQLTAQQLQEPCIQVALFDSENGGTGNYHEVVTFIVPFCASSWCGFDYETIERTGVTPWFCLPIRCKANIVILTVLFVILAVLITASNLTVIIVYATEKKSRHSQGIFRLSLGVADILVGLVVFPSAAGIAIAAYQHLIPLQPPFNVTGLERITEANESDVFRNSTVAVQMLEFRQMIFQEIFPDYFLNIIGFISTISLTVSIYLLTVSGIDRLQAISRPVSYRQHQAKRFATISSMIAWISAFVVSILPVFLDGLNYDITGTGIVTLLGRTSLILYAVGFFLPLIATWIIAIAMFKQGRKSFKRRANMSTIRHQQIAQQRRLNRILSLMVTAFSVSVIPTILVLILLFIIPGTNDTIVETYNPVANNLANSLEAVATIILLSNSLWNCLIYSARTKNFRKTAGQKYRAIWKVINPFNWCRKICGCKTICGLSTPRMHRRSFSKSVTASSGTTASSNAANTTVRSSSGPRRNLSSSQVLQSNSQENIKGESSPFQESFKYKSQDSKV